MIRQIICLLLVGLVCGQVFGQRKSYDWGNLSDDEIEELRALPHPCAELKSRRHEAAVKRGLLNEGIRLDGNQADYDIRYYGIDIAIYFGSHSIDGHIDYQIRAVVDGLNAVDLNLHDQLVVDSVRVNDQNAAFSHYSHLLAITTPESFDQDEEFSMTVYYHGQPVSGYSYTEGGMGFMNHGGYDICWTATEPFSSRNWWPCKDYPSDKADSIDLYIEYPEAFDVAANGVLVSDVNIGGGRKRVHWKHNYPIVTYLVALTCADFVIETKTWDYDGYSMPVYSYTLPNAYESREVFDTLTIPMLNIYSDAFGVYPFVNEKLANANCGVYGTMEHQTCSFHDPFAWYYDNVYLLIHENGHQWWGDMITCRTFNHIWLNEGLTTWTEAIFYEGQFGMAAYHDRVQGYKYLGRGTIYVENVYTDVIFDGNLSYAKASWVPHMLRGVLGDSVFFKAIRDWYDSPFKYGTAITADFTWVISQNVGEDMSWFVNQWIYGEGHPDYEISWLCSPDTGAGFQLFYCIEQTQSGGTDFTMPIKTTFVTTVGALDTVIFNDSRIQVYSLWFADSVTNVIFDPEEWILRTVTTVPMTAHIATIYLADGIVGEPYWQDFQAIGGVPPYHWTFLGGDLPYGLSWEGDTVAVVSGIPTYPATFYFNLQMTDSDSPPYVETRGYSITVNEGFVVGDADGDEIINISDVVYLINYIFGGGPVPEPMSSGDADCSGTVDVADVVFLIAYIFSGGPAPECP